MLTFMNTGGIASTNCFLLADEAAREAALFDAPDHTAEPLLKEVAKRGWTLSVLYLTHGHFDHFADHAIVRERFPNARILLHQEDCDKFENPDLQTRLFDLPFEIPPGKPDAFVVDGQRLSIGSIELVVLHTPGHSPGHVCYHFPKEEVLVGGDLIIGGSVGRTDLPDSNHLELVASVRKVMALPGATRLLGGHGRPSTLAEERRSNAFVGQMLE